MAGVARSKHSKPEETNNVSSNCTRSISSVCRSNPAPGRTAAVPPAGLVHLSCVTGSVSVNAQKKEMGREFRLPPSGSATNAAAAAQAQRAPRRPSPSPPPRSRSRDGRTDAARFKVAICPHGSEEFARLPASLTTITPSVIRSFPQSLLSLSVNFYATAAAAAAATVDSTRQQEAEQRRLPAGYREEDVNVMEMTRLEIPRQWT